MVSTNNRYELLNVASYQHQFVPQDVDGAIQVQISSDQIGKKKNGSRESKC